MRINAQSIRTKEQRREEEKLLDIRDLEYMKKKLVRLESARSQSGKDPQVVHDWLLPQEREAEQEEEQKRAKKEKELEISRLRAQQERAKDHKAEQVRLELR